MLVLLILFTNFFPAKLQLLKLTEIESASKVTLLETAKKKKKNCLKETSCIQRFRRNL